MHDQPGRFDKGRISEVGNRQQVRFGAEVLRKFGSLEQRTPALSGRVVAKQKLLKTWHGASPYCAWWIENYFKARTVAMPMDRGLVPSEFPASFATGQTTKKRLNAKSFRNLAIEQWLASRPGRMDASTVVVQQVDRAADGSKPVVLVVEDEGLIRLCAMDMIEEAGFQAIEAADADEAIRILEGRNDIRAVFTDIQMPGSMDGLRLAQVVRNRWPPVALVVTSGQQTVLESDLPKGGRFLLKPYQATQIKGVLQQLIH
jgi:CheY-like chemotaxis protein